MPTRREILKSVAATITAWFLPHRLFATTTTPRFHFIHADTLDFWPAADPLQWCLDHTHDPILQRASEGLAKLTAEDGDRIIRLIVRRCRLNLLEVQTDQVVVHHWSSQRADLRPFFKHHGLARPQVEVVLRERKKEVAITQHGDDFLFGDRLAGVFPLNLYQSKWASRYKHQPDDCQAAPGTWSGFAWESVEANRIPWAALKSAWQRATPMMCQNCDRPTILTNFGHPWKGIFNRTPRFVHVCSKCQKSFRDETVKDVNGWMATNLDAEARPDAEMVWDRRVARNLKWSA